MTGRVGVLVMAHGTPQRNGDIASFYTRIRRGRPPSPEQLAELEQRYGAIGGLSPLTERTRAQVDAVRSELDRRAPGHYVVAYGAKHADPLIEEAAATLAGEGVHDVIGLVLTPHGSSMGSEEYLTRAHAALAGKCGFRAVPPWYAEPDLVTLLAERVNEALVQVGMSRDTVDRDQTRSPVVFTAHSLPVRIRDMGDTYPEQLQESAALVAAAAGLVAWQVAWQSAGRTPDPWLGPDIRDAMRKLAAPVRAPAGGEPAEGAVHGVVVCPLGFVTDHLEVLYDLDVEAAAVADELGLAFARTATLNDDPRFIGVLADVIGATEARRG